VFLCIEGTLQESGDSGQISRFRDLRMNESKQIVISVSGFGSKFSQDRSRCIWTDYYKELLFFIPFASFDIRERILANQLIGRHNLWRSPGRDV
jgi:hypothetical protein